MDLSRVSNEKKLYLCKWYFKGDYYIEFPNSFKCFKLIIFNSWICPVTICLGHKYCLVLQWSLQETGLQWTERDQEV